MNYVIMQNESSQRKKIKRHLACAIKLCLANNNIEGALDKVKLLNDTLALKKTQFRI